MEAACKGVVERGVAVLSATGATMSVCDPGLGDAREPNVVVASTSASFKGYEAEVVVIPDQVTILDREAGKRDRIEVRLDQGIAGLAQEGGEVDGALGGVAKGEAEFREAEYRYTTRALLDVWQA